MRKRKSKSIKRVISLTPEANHYLNGRARELGLSGAEYIRRLVLIEGYDGAVLDDIRAIMAQTGDSIPIEEYAPFIQAVLQRLDEGLKEINELEHFVKGLPTQIAQSKANLQKIRQQFQEEMLDLRKMREFMNVVNKQTSTTRTATVGRKDT